MTKEQFKKSISNLINYYTNSAITYSMNLASAQKNQEEEVCGLIQGQMQALGFGFEKSLDELLDEVFPEEEDSEMVEDTVE